MVGGSVSDIYGHLDANGQVFLVNPNGVYFAPGARVDVGGIVASTLGISNSDFLNGNYRFSGARRSGVVNAGQIRTAHGGAITARGGRVVLSARAKDALLRTVVNNTGVICAQGVARHGGVIELLGGHSGTTEVAGTLDATPASNGAAAVRIETSGAHLKLGKASIHAGVGGQWLVDPVDLTIDTNAATTIESG